VIGGFVVQGGGFTEDLTRKETHDPIVSEASNGLTNGEGSIAMARTSDPDSATSQFYFNLNDNVSLDYVEGDPDHPGYTVFGHVLGGWGRVQDMGDVATRTYTGFGEDVPIEPIIITNAYLVIE